MYFEVYSWFPFGRGVTPGPWNFIEKMKNVSCEYGLPGTIEGALNSNITKS